MNPILLSFLVGSLGGPLGGLLAAIAGSTLMRKVNGSIRAAILSFAAGFILSVAFLELLHRAIRDAAGWELIAVVCGVTAGAAIRGLVTYLTGDYLGDLFQGDGSYRKLEARKIAFSLAIVNLIEGLTIGIGFVVSRDLGFLVGAIMIFENFTEGISVSAELAQGKQSTKSMYLLTVTPTVTLGFGAAAGAFFGGISSGLLGVLLGAGAGIMFYVVMDDIIYDAHKLARGAATTGPVIAGIITGILITSI